MDALIEILKFILPAVLVFLTTFYVLKRFLDREQQERVMELKKNNQQTVTPIRLQAYERLVLFLERISVNNLVMRVFQNDMSARYFRDRLLISIREEYDHNLSQQIYVSNSCWDQVRQAKEEMIKFINTEAEQLDEGASAFELSKRLFDKASQQSRMPTQVAIDHLKDEIRRMF